MQIKTQVNNVNLHEKLPSLVLREAEVQDQAYVWSHYEGVWIKKLIDELIECEAAMPSGSWQIYYIIYLQISSGEIV